MGLGDKLASLIGFGKVTGPGADNKAYSIQQVTYDGKAANAFVVFPYGMHGNLPADILALVLAIEGDSANRVAIGGFSTDRPTMAAGEVCFFHPPTGSIIHFKESGALKITTGTQAVTINCSTATVNGDAVVTGSLDVTGDISCANITATTEVTAGAVTLTGHKHPVTTAPGTTGVGAG